MKFLRFGGFEFNSKIVLVVESKESGEELKPHKLVLHVDNSKCETGIPKVLSETFYNETSRDVRLKRIRKVLNT